MFALLGWCAILTLFLRMCVLLSLRAILVCLGVSPRSFPSLFNVWTAEFESDSHVPRVTFGDDVGAWAPNCDRF